jgi:hypothetical protein
MYHKINPEFGYISVQQVRTMIDDNGFLKSKTVSAIVPGLLRRFTSNQVFMLVSN